MRRAWQVVGMLCVLALVVAFCGCGGSSSPGGPAEGAAAKPPPPPAPRPIVFDRNPSARLGSGIFRMNADGSGILQLTGKNQGSNSWPSWSPTGDRIVFTSNRGGLNDLWTMNADGSNPTQLTDHPTNDSYGDYWADWGGPTGTTVAFIRYEDIWTIDVVTKHETQLTSNYSVTFEKRPNWSPDGSQLAFGSSAGNDPPYVYLMNAGGSDVRPLTQGSWPAWSPTGTRIACERYGGDLWTIAPDGTGLTQITSGAGGHYRPTWSPDGAEIAFAANPGSTASSSEVYKVALGTGAVTRLTDNNVYDGNPDWRW